MLLQDLLACLDKMEKMIEEYTLGDLGRIRIFEERGFKLFHEEINVNAGGKLIISNENIPQLKEKLQEELIYYLNRKQLEYDNKLKEVKKLTSILEKKGLEKTSKYYQTLQNKNVEGGN